MVNQLSAEIDQFFAKYTVPGHSGLDMEHQPECTPASPWLVAARKHEQHDLELENIQRTTEKLAESKYSI